jgi:DNA-binding MarR family transcriptional regulator
VSALEAGTQHADFPTLDQQMCFSLAVASRSVIALYRPLLEPLGLTHPQYLAMVALWQREPMSVKEISALLQLDSASVSPVLKRLEAAGFVDRQRGIADERLVTLSLTERGRALKDQARHIPQALMERLDMSVEELLSLQAALQRLIVQVQSAGGDGAPRPSVG